MLRDDAHFRLSELQDEYSDGWDVETQLRAWSVYCEALVNAGYVSLLADANPKQLSLWLARAGANWRVLLSRARKHGFVVPAHVNLPLLALLAIGDVAGAAELAELSARARAELEYEDEFLHAFLLQEVLGALARGALADPDREALRPLVVALRAEAADARPDLWQAVIDGDAAAYWSAVAALGAAYKERMLESKADPAADYFGWRAAQFVWLEGLALVRLGERLAFGGPPDGLPCLPPSALLGTPARDDGKFLLAR